MVLESKWNILVKKKNLPGRENTVKFQVVLKRRIKVLADYY